MTITTNTHHDDHVIRIHLCKNKGPHYAALRCVECNKHIQWLNPSQTESLEQLGVDIFKQAAPSLNNS